VDTHNSHNTKTNDNHGTIIKITGGNSPKSDCMAAQARLPNPNLQNCLEVPDRITFQQETEPPVFKWIKSNWLICTIILVCSLLYFITKKLGNRKRGNQGGGPSVLATAIVLLNCLTLTIGLPLHDTNPFKDDINQSNNRDLSNPFIEPKDTLHTTIHVANDYYHPALYFEHFLTIFNLILNLTALYFNYALEKQAREGQILLQHIKEQNSSSLRTPDFTRMTTFTKPPSPRNSTLTKSGKVRPKTEARKLLSISVNSNLLPHSKTITTTSHNYL